MQDKRELFQRFHSMQTSESSERCCASTSVTLFVLCEFGGVFMVLDVASSEMLETFHQKVSDSHMHNKVKSKCSFSKSNETSQIHRKIGYELSENDKYTKPKHRIIADAYAKRMDDVISVSIENSLTDPAGLNFDVNNLAESNGMSTTFLNCLNNTILRRNALTMDTMEPNPPYSSCADNNSEISLSVCHLSVESRRTSIDSQVSQVSVKMSETNIKAVLDTKQKDKKVNMETKKRQHKYLYSKRTSRRASSSSVESQRITSQMRNIKYHRPSNRIQVSSNMIGRQIERRSAIPATSADINDIRQLFNQCNFKHTTTDDDQSIDEPMNAMNEPPNMLVPLGAHKHQIANSTESLDTSIKQAAIEKIVKNFLQNSSGKQLENFLRSSYEYNANGMGKSGRGSMKNGKNQRSSGHKTHEHPSNQHKMRMSMSSSEDIDAIQKLNGSQSSLSNQSINRLTTQSQNSKGSCDVGIQANEYDISRQRSRDDCDKDNFPEKHKFEYHQDDEYTEVHQLLPGKKRDQPMIYCKNAKGSERLSEAEKFAKLKELLLP